MKVFKILILICFLSCFSTLSAQPVVSLNIHIDQFGYRPNDLKVAVLADPQIGFNSSDSYTPGNTIYVVDTTTGSTVFSAGTLVWNNGATHSQSGDKVWWFDFSAFTQEGVYYLLDSTNNLRSNVFEISQVVYNNVLKQAMRVFFYQRCGMPKAAPHVESGWGDVSCHLHPGQDLDCRLVTDPTNPATSRDLSGGWHDAGDHNKYVNYAFNTCHDLLSAYRERPEIWTDDYNIPESGNGIPDILDELKWELDWLLRMQESDGSVLMKVSVGQWQTGSPPSSDLASRFYGPAQASATRVACGIFAHAAIAFSQLPQTAMQVYADTLCSRAEAAWSWVMANPGYSYYNNAGFNSTAIEFSEYRQDAALTLASAYLFGATGNPIYRSHFDLNYQNFNSMQWWFWYPFETAFQDVMLYYASLPNSTAGVKTAIHQNFITSATSNNSEMLPTWLAQTDAYRAFYTDQNYQWGSNIGKSHSGTNFFNLVTFNLDSSNHSHYRHAAQGYLHYLHGVNPLNLVYMTNMGANGAENSCNEMYHGWFGHGTDFDNTSTSLYGPPPGFVTGGANGFFSPDPAFGGTISPPQNQPVQKSYKDWNTGWPENSWELTEPSITNQAAYVKLLSKFVSEPTCPSPQLVATNDITPTSAVLNWQQVQESESYQIRGRNVSGSQWTYLSVFNPLDTTKQVLGLIPNTSYVWQIQSTCSGAITSGWSEIDTFETVCQVPDSNWTSPVTVNGARLNWTRVTGAVGYGIVGKRVGPGGWTNLQVGGGNTLSKDIFGLQENTAYTWAVRGICDVNSSYLSSFSELDTFTTLTFNVQQARLSESKQDVNWIGAISMFPNPTNDKVRIESEVLDEEERILILNTAGQLMKEISTWDFRDPVEIDVSNWPPGVYFVKAGLVVRPLVVR